MEPPGSCLIPQQMRSRGEHRCRRRCTLQRFACPTSNLASGYRATRAALWVRREEEEDSEEEGKEWQQENNQKTPWESSLLFLPRKTLKKKYKNPSLIWRRQEGLSTLAPSLLKILSSEHRNRHTWARDCLQAEQFCQALATLHQPWGARCCPPSVPSFSTPSPQQGSPLFPRTL